MYRCPKKICQKEKPLSLKSISLPQLAALICVATLLQGCNDDAGPEAIIRAKIESAQHAVEEKDASEVVESLVDEFSANNNMDKQSLRRLLALLFLQHKNINVVITRLDISINEYDPSTAHMEAVVLATGAQNILPQNGRLFTISGDWIKKDDEWLLSWASWK